MGRFEGRCVIVTGAGSGFGAATARRFATEGASVVVADVDDAAAKRVATEIGDSALAVTADVTDDAAVAAMVAAAEGQFGGLDVLVNNAGLTNRMGPVEATSDADYERVMGVNFKGVFLGVRHGVPALRRRGGGVIVNTSSIAAASPRPGVAVYCAAKGAVLTFTQALATELAPTIRVNAVLPMAAETNFMIGALGSAELPDEIRARFVQSVPLGRMCEPDDVAGAIAFLASDDARYLTGVCLPVDGGRSI